MAAPWLTSLFPRLSAQAADLGVPSALLSAEPDPLDPERVLSHAAAICGAAEALAQARGLEDLLHLCDAFIADIYDSRRRDSVLDATHWDFLRLFVSVCPLKLCVGRG